MDSSTLSAIMRGKRPITIKTARRLIEALGVTDPFEAQHLMMSCGAEGLDGQEVVYSEMSMEVAEAIAGWEHFAILAVLELSDFKATPKKISTRLNVPVQIVQVCLDRLQKLELVRMNNGGVWEVTGKDMATPSQIPSFAIREGHRQFINKALESLEKDSVEARDITGITMAIKKSNLPRAKELIKDFRLRLAKFLESGSKTDAVYRLNIQLFPLTGDKS
jgi:uncharacterized protein (TIGR02147 family)